MGTGSIQTLYTRYWSAIFSVARKQCNVFSIISLTRTLLFDFLQSQYEFYVPEMKQHSFSHVHLGDAQKRIQMILNPVLKHICVLKRRMIMKIVGLDGGRGVIRNRIEDDSKSVK